VTWAAASSPLGPTPPYATQVSLAANTPRHWHFPSCTTAATTLHRRTLGRDAAGSMQLLTGHTP